MRFMMFIYPGLAEEQGWEPRPEDVSAMMAYNEELTRAGVLLALDGLHAPSTATIVHGAAGGARPTVKDGPFAESKEMVGGYWIIDVKSKDDAVAWASRCPLGEHDAIEVRQVYEMSDFPEDVQEAAGKLSQEPPAQTRAR